MEELKVMETRRSEEEVLEENKAVLKRIRRENAKKRMHTKVLFVLTCVTVLVVTFTTGIIVGRLLAFLYAMGC